MKAIMCLHHVMGKWCCKWWKLSSPTYSLGVESGNREWSGVIAEAGG
ncbi:MAG: hypothetical protein JSW07_09410 [bacterium]|nr:MAG: hypothetical protein JSW07_09410 [bacterium]